MPDETQNPWERFISYMTPPVSPIPGRTQGALGQAMNSFAEAKKLQAGSLLRSMANWFSGGKVSQQNQLPIPSPTPTPSSSGGLGAVIGIIIVVLLLAAGGAYFFYIQTQQQKEAEAAQAQQQAAANPISESNIEADLNAAATTDSNADLDALQGSL